MAEPKTLGPHLDPRRIDALWQATAPKVSLRERRRQRLRILALAAALPLFALAGYWAGRGPPPQRLEVVGDRIAAHQEASQFTLRDGSSVEAGPDTAVTLSRLEEQEIGLTLSRGRARFQVSKRPERRFQVRVADVTVTVVGTRFVVRSEEEQVEVQVEEGVVEIEHHGHRSTLKAGQSWSRPRVDALREPPSSVQPSSPSEAEAPDDLEAKAPPPPAPAVIEDRPLPRGVGKPRGQRAQADQRFEAALEARRSGDSQAALRAFREFLRLHPNHPRMALASFELGRLEMDVAHDLDAAVIALERAVLAGRGANFAEDALARLIQAQAGRGDRRGCQEARKLYADRYPTGSYAASLATLCP